MNTFINFISINRLSRMETNANALQYVWCCCCGFVVIKFIRLPYARIGVNFLSLNAFIAHLFYFHRRGRSDVPAHRHLTVRRCSECLNSETTDVNSNGLHRRHWSLPVSKRIMKWDKDLDWISELKPRHLDSISTHASFRYQWKLRAAV